MGSRRKARVSTPTLVVACASAILLSLSGVAGASPRMLQNGSLEQWSGSTPTCWLLGGYGSNTSSWIRTSDRYAGRSAVRLDVTNWTSGDRKLLTSFNSACSPVVSAGHVYTVSVWYKANARPVFFAFTPNPAGNGYSFWAQSPQMPSAADWTRAVWTTPVIPQGKVNLSVGFGLQGPGSLTMDALSMVDSTGSGGADTTAPAVGITCNGSPCTGYYNAAVSVGLTATDDIGGSGVAQIRYTTDGSSPTATTGSVYSAPFMIGQTTAVKFLAVDNVGNVSPVGTESIIVDRTAPSVTLTSPSAGATLTGTSTISASAWDDVGVKQVSFFVDGTLIGSDPTGTPYTIGWSSWTAVNGLHTVAARAVDAAGNVASSGGVVVTVVNSVPDPLPAAGYFATLPSEAVGLPRGDSYCAANVTTSSWEPRVDNFAANHSVPSVAVPWSNAEVGSYWSKWIARRGLVTGAFTGTTNQVIQWAACKWGLDEDLLRAVAVQESDWRESMVGDNCGTVGQASYGLFQIKNAYCNGAGAWGGYPYTASYSALNADFYGAYIRSCFDNHFYDGGAWLYGGRTIAQIIAASGLDYALWGCVGSWFSGHWYDSGAQTYINSVKQHLANKDWLKY
jgi:autotransporter family porin